MSRTVSPQSKMSQSQDKKRQQHAQSGQSTGINDIFDVMEKNFDQTFKNVEQTQIPKLPTDQVSHDPNKSASQSSRSNRKLKPIYSTLINKQASPSSDNFNSDDKFNFKSTDQNHKNHSKEQQSLQKSNKSSPIAKIMGRLNQSNVSDFKHNQEDASSIQNIQTQRKPVKSHQAIETLDDTPNDPTSSPKVLNYKDLHEKIESALKKNNNYKPFGTSRLNKSNFTSRSFNEFNQMLLTRFEEYEKNRERQIQQKKIELQQRKQKELKFHPKINKKSLQFIEQMGGHEPIEMRYQKILELKNKRLEQYQEQKKIKEEEEYEQFKEEFEKYKKEPQEDTRSYDKFYEEMFKWKQRSIKNAEEKKKLMEEEKLKQTNTFQPKINQKSSKIVMNSIKSEKYLPIHQRQVPAEKKFKSKIDQECTFKPKINKRKVK